MRALLKNIANDVHTCWMLMRVDKARHNGISILQKVAAWRNGFLPDSFLMYDTKNNTTKRYLSDFYRFRYGSKINGHFQTILDDKFLFNRVFEHARLIKPVLTQVNGTIRDSDDQLVTGPMALKNLLGKGRYVIKPAFGGGGAGIKFISIDSNIQVNGMVTDECGLWKEVTRYRISVVDKYIEQTGFARDVFPDSVNTIRLLTMFDHTVNKAFLAHATFRCGTSNSGMVDNWTSGGLSIRIEKESGRLGKGAPFPKKGKLQWFSSHPETNVKFEGVVLPYWDDIVTEILLLADRYSYIPYIGWDIISMAEGFFILEANSNSGVNFLQIHYPLLDDPRIKSFYSYYGKV